MACKPLQQSQLKQPTQRRGVLMLLVLIILAMFVLLVITYLLSSAQSQRLATAGASSSDTGGPIDPSQAQADLGRVARELTAGSTNVRSPFHKDSLLEDMWGHDDTRPFSGTGVDSGDATDNDVPYALQPNPRGWLTGTDFDTLDSNFVTALDGGTDEDYDAPDFDNPALAIMDESGAVTRPSFHDPWLFNYLENEETWNVALRRRISFRPLTEDHTDFDGGNSGFDAITGPWDIDNDGDGKADSVWIYTGDPAQLSTDGQQIVPLYAILLVDLDGRLNANLHSHGTLVAGSGTGFGTGPAEISLDSITSDESALISARHGTDSKPGSDDDPIWQLEQTWTLPTAAWTPGDLNGWGSPHDIYGLGSVTLTGAGEPTYASLSEPGTNLENPYRVNVNTGIGDDEFTFSEMEAVLRPNDIDAGTLPQRLAGLVDSSARYTMTTYSVDSTAPGGPYDPADLTNTPPRLADNQRINISMRFGDGEDNDSNDVVDEPGETGQLAWWATGDAPAAPTGIDAFENIDLDVTNHNRTALCTRLFDVAMAVTAAHSASGLWTTADDREKYLAQWAVNVVDFRDRDSIMTKFNYDTGDSAKVVWGCESPHLVISETACFHDRGTRDTNGDGAFVGSTAPDDDTDFDQVRRPRASLFVELKNRDSTGESLPAELYDLTGTDAGKLDLARTTATGSAPVWRLAITLSTATATLDQPTLTAADVERAVYFISKPGTLPTLPAASLDYWASAAGPAIGSGEYCTIGPAGVTEYGTWTRSSPTAAPTYGGSIDLSTATGNIVQIPDVVHTSPAETRFSASEPVAGYTSDTDDEDATTRLYTTPIDVPFDDADTDLKILGSIDDYKVIHLQRLANPLIAWDADDNPYITVDSMPLTLTVYTGEKQTADTAEEFTASNMAFNTRERDGATVNNVWAASYPAPTTGTVAAPLTNLSLGAINTGLVAPTGANMFPWLTWNNRPYLSRMELLLVPHSEPQKLLADHSTINSGSPYTAHPGAFGHLPNFFNRPSTAADRPQLQRILEYVDVPSPFAGTKLYPSPAAGTPQHPSYYGQGVFGAKAFTTPGRVNINTLTEPVWDAILNGMPGPSFAELEASRQGFADADAAKSPTAIARPFRSFAGKTATASNTDVKTYYDGTTTDVPEMDFTLLRSDGGGTEQPLFAIDSAADATNSDRNPYFRYRLLTKLGSTVTNRSHVYACWITVGYFEAETVPASAAFPEGIKIGKEVNAGGSVTRHRAFFLIDRSRSDYTGTAFQRGDESQLDKVIILDRPIE